MDIKQYYLEVAEGKGKRMTSEVVAFSPSRLNLAELEERLASQTFFTQGDIEYAEHDENSFYYTCHYGDEELLFLVSLAPRAPELEINPYYSTDPLSAGLLAEVNQTEQDIYVECLLQNDVLRSYRYQLKMVQILVPDLLLGIDISAAGRGFTREWLNFQLENDVQLNIESLYTIHAIYDTENSPPTMYWFHTHGLLRCGIPEVELLLPHTINAYYGIPDLLRSFIGQSLNEGKVLFNEPMLCGQTEKQLEYIVALPYQEGIRQINKNTPIDQLKSLEEIDYSHDNMPENEFLGDRGDRDDQHDHPSCMLFRVNESSPVLQTFFRGFDDDAAIMFYRPNSETHEMAVKARLRWHYFAQMFAEYGQPVVKTKKGLLSGLFGKKARDEEDEHPWAFMVKCGIPYGDEDDLEHMWFIPETLDNDVFTGKLINQPFYVEEMEEGGVYPLNTEMLTDWNIYFSGEKYTPDTIYQLLSPSQVH